MCVMTFAEMDCQTVASYRVIIFQSSHLSEAGCHGLCASALGVDSAEHKILNTVDFQGLQITKDSLVHQRHSQSAAKLLLPSWV